MSDKLFLMSATYVDVHEHIYHWPLQHCWCSLIYVLMYPKLFVRSTGSVRHLLSYFLMSTGWFSVFIGLFWCSLAHLLCPPKYFGGQRHHCSMSARLSSMSTRLFLMSTKLVLTSSRILVDVHYISSDVHWSRCWWTLDYVWYPLSDFDVRHVSASTKLCSMSTKCF